MFFCFQNRQLTWNAVRGAPSWAVMKRSCLIRTFRPPLRPRSSRRFTATSSKMSNLLRPTPVAPTSVASRRRYDTSIIAGPELQAAACWVVAWWSKLDDIIDGWRPNGQRTNERASDLLILFSSIFESSFDFAFGRSDDNTTADLLFSVVLCVSLYSPLSLSRAPQSLQLFALNFLEACIFPTKQWTLVPPKPICVPPPPPIHPLDLRCRSFNRFFRSAFLLSVFFFFCKTLFTDPHTWWLLYACPLFCSDTSSSDALPFPLWPLISYLKINSLTARSWLLILNFFS